MYISQIFTKTTKENPAGEVSVNAQLLERGGFVYKNSAGVYTFLPLGWKVAQKITAIIREEMNAIGGQEMFMPALVEKKYLDATGRWDVGVGFKILDKLPVTDSELQVTNFVLGWTHEEVITEMASKFISSYKDLPFSAYQIQTKFRNEPRAKSGLLRGREFMMKDLYSFHTSEEDMLEYYGKVKDAYAKIFERCGLKAYYTVAAGGDFTAENTHEFQVLSEVGEDTIFLCEKCEYAENSEISKLKTGEKCPTRLPDGQECGGDIKEEKSIEVGNIFPLGTKYSDAFNFKFTDEKGGKHSVVMGSYGIGIGRVMGATVEVSHDDKGIIWPDNITPFNVHLVDLTKNGEGKDVYEKLIAKNIEVLYDDRTDKTAGEKFADADLLGCPVRLVVSEKTLKENSVEVKRRAGDEIKLVLIEELERALVR
ncbi:MAG: aminoacyl--tRNA ligase-related protein [bacterium]|nr:aminoacyl--tRNA ligase-related protein [bacterium]